MSVPPDTAASEVRQEGVAIPEQLADRIGFLVAKSHAVCHAMANEALSPLDLHIKEYAVLNVLHGMGAMSQQALGETLGVDRTTMVAVMDELERKQLVRRSRNPADRRAYALAITDPGVEVLRRARRLLTAAERKLLAPLSAAEADQLRDLLRRLILGR
jgi:DNA-binding MarR family transcriptional regulator